VSIGFFAYSGIRVQGFKVQGSGFKVQGGRKGLASEAEIGDEEPAFWIALSVG
jgi:hypothetical protein